MNIYKLNNKGLIKEIRKFSKTTYGKIVFLLSYTIPIIFFLITIILLYLLLNTYGIYRYMVLRLFLISIISTLIFFIIGSINYYKELRLYIEEKEKD